MLEGVSTTALLIYVSLLVVVVIALTLLALLLYSGLTQPVDEVGTAKPPLGRAVVAYKFQQGNYGSAGQIFTEAAIIAPENKAVGIYYDDVDKVDSNLTRYVVASVLSEDSSPVDEVMANRFREKGYKILHLPEVTYAVQTKFPHITTLSILIAVHKAYPRLKSYIEEHQLCAHPFIEIYDGKTIHFMVPLSKQNEFYVPECQQKTDPEPAGSADGDKTTPALSPLVGPADTAASNQEGIVQPVVLNQKEEVPSVMEVAEPTVVTSDEREVNGNNNDNNGSVEGAGEDGANDDDERASNDSSSSFEVLRTENIE